MAVYTILEILIIINILLSAAAAWYASRPRTITLVEKETSNGVSRTAILTPSGTFVVPEKRDAVSNSDEELWNVENGQ
jgi:hypothetical protein